MKSWNFSLCIAILMVVSMVPGNKVSGVEVVVGGEVIKLEKNLPDVDDLWVTAEDFTRINGFILKPQGACYEEICIPLRQETDSDLFVKRDGESWFNATAFASKIEQAHVVDQDAEVWSFGMVPTSRKAFLDSAIAPDFSLADRNGDLVKLSDFRGKKVLIITWASW